jgi:hypothetical protein
VKVEDEAVQDHLVVRNNSGRGGFSNPAEAHERSGNRGGEVWQSYHMRLVVKTCRSGQSRVKRATEEEETQVISSSSQFECNGR